MLSHAMPRVGLISVVLASYSTVLPRGPFTRQRLVSGPVARISSTFRIILGKFWKSDQYKKTSCSGASTSMLSCTRLAILSFLLLVLFAFLKDIPEKKADPNLNYPE